MEQRARRVTEEEHELSALMAERDRVINSLQELDFDFKLGKIPEEDYPAAARQPPSKRCGYFAKDRFARFLPPMGSGRMQEQDTEARLEKAIAARRADGSVREVRAHRR